MTCTGHKRYTPKHIALNVLMCALIYTIQGVIHARSCPENKGTGTGADKHGHSA